MRVLLSPSSKKFLCSELKRKYGCKTIRQLATRINIHFKTLDEWFYVKGRYIPMDFLKKEKINAEIIDEKEDGWWRIKGGKAGHAKIIEKYGLKGLKKSQSLGGKKAAASKLLNARKTFRINISDPDFLELYGALLGDGWISSPHARSNWVVGVCGHRTLDREFIYSLKDKVKRLFNREGFFREQEKTNTLSFLFSHRLFVEFLSKDLNFPIGRKENLRLNRKILNLGFSKFRHVMRGIFDTDGTIYFTKSKNNIYPHLAIHMNEPILINQLREILIGRGFMVNYSDHGKMIRLNGREQLSKWMNEIGSSNPKHLKKIALVAQPG